MPDHHPALDGHRRDLDELAWELWLEATLATLECRAAGEDLDPAAGRRIAEATFATRHPETNERLALWRMGLTAPPPDADWRRKALAQQQAATVMDRGDPDTEAVPPHQMGGWA